VHVVLRVAGPRAAPAPADRGEGGDGPGGTGDLVNKVEDLGASCEIINTKALFGL